MMEIFESKSLNLSSLKFHKTPIIPYSYTNLCHDHRFERIYVNTNWGLPVLEIFGN